MIGSACFCAAEIAVPAGAEAQPGPYAESLPRTSRFCAASSPQTNPAAPPTCRQR